LISSATILALSLPFALVPYYLLPPPTQSIPTATPTISFGVFGQLPADDGWVNIARIFQCVLGLGTCNVWILRGRDSILGGIGVERGERLRIGRWVGLGLWIVVVFFACLGGWIAEKIEILGVIATLAVGWLLPCEFFGVQQRSIRAADRQPYFSSSRFTFALRCRSSSRLAILHQILPPSRRRDLHLDPTRGMTAYLILPPMSCWLARNGSYKKGDWEGVSGRI